MNHDCVLVSKCCNQGVNWKPTKIVKFDSEYRNVRTTWKVSMTITLINMKLKCSLTRATTWQDVMLLVLCLGPLPKPHIFKDLPLVNYLLPGSSFTIFSMIYVTFMHYNTCILMNKRPFCTTMNKIAFYCCCDMFKKQSL